MDNSAGASQAHGTKVTVTALVCFVNLVVITMALFALVVRYDAMDQGLAGVSAAEDILFPFVPILLCQAAVNGFALALRETSRRAGVGILVGTLTATVAAVAWWYLVLLSSFQ